MTIDFDAIREAIEARHQRDLATIAAAPRQQTISGMVMSVLQTEFVAAYQIAERTGLGLQQVRGVINSALLRSKIEKRRHNGVTKYYCPLFEPAGKPKQKELLT